MTDSTSIVWGMTPEHVALELYRDIKFLESGTKLERAWILETYAECLRTVHHPTDQLERNAGLRSEAPAEIKTAI
jgi:hypothetical protein